MAPGLFERTLIAAICVLLGRTAYAGQSDSSSIEAPSQRPPAATRVLPPAASAVEVPQASGWVLIEPPMKPNPYGRGAWSVDLLAPQDKWVRLEHVFASEEECVQYRQAELQNMAAGFTADDTSLKLPQELHDAYQAGDKAKIAQTRERIQANLTDAMKLAGLVTAMRDARCVPK